MWIDPKTLYINMFKKLGLSIVAILAMIVFVAVFVYLGFIYGQSNCP